MKVEPLYVGFVPLASCHWQGLANILESQGFSRARQKICLSWGFSWDGHSRVLGNSGRWLSAFNDVFDGQLAREEFESWGRADRRELELTEAGLAFVAEIDAFEVPSSYELVEHVSHTVVVLDRDEQGAVLLDTMNSPEPRRYPLERYRRMRTDACVDRAHLYVSAGLPAGDLTPDQLLVEVPRIFQEHWPREMRALELYLQHARGEARALDVCRVGAERLQLAATMSLLAEAEPALLEISRGLSSLSKRWYLVHTLAEHQTRARRDGRVRILRLLADLRDREMRLAESFLTAAAQALAT